MNHKIIKLLFAFSCTFSIAFLAQTAFGQSPPKRYVAITFDDLPVACQCETNAERRAITEKLIWTFKKHQMPILGVVNEQKLEVNGIVDPERVSLLKQWLAAGLELGNHGYSHKNINEISFDDYKNEILKGERITRPLANALKIPYRFFRHPYLSAGDNLKIRKGLDAFLKTHHYTVAPNTIIYQDYTFSWAYEAAIKKGDSALIQKIRDAYVPYTLNRWETAEKQSVELFGREVKQILMVHANLINADMFDTIAALMQKRGYVFISVDEALQDPAYSRPDTFDGNVGVTWLSRWAAEMGKKFTMKGMPVQDFVLEAAKDGHD